MPKLWVFGDSFVVDQKDMEASNQRRVDSGLFPPFQEIENNWVGIVSEKLTGDRRHNNKAIAGCSNEYIFYELIEHAGQFQEGDYVILSLTAENRRWLIDRLPHLANWSNCTSTPDEPDSPTKAEAKAIEQYGRYLDNLKSSQAIHASTFWGSVAIASSVAHLGVKFLILPGFHEIHSITGTLSTASWAEFDCEKTLNKYYKRTTDDRWNHFSEVNHKILADKVIDFFEDTNHNIDLTTGFVKDIYTKENT